MATTYVEQMLELQAQEQAIKEKREKLLAQAKTEALANAERAVADLNNLGFNYKLVEVLSNATPARAPSTRAPRKGGVSEQVVAAVKASPDGLTRSGAFAALGAEDDKTKTSITNALANAKKKGLLTLTDGVYKAA